MYYILSPVTYCMCSSQHGFLFSVLTQSMTLFYLTHIPITLLLLLIILEYIVNAINKKHIDKEDNIDNLINREHPLKLKNNNKKL